MDNNFEYSDIPFKKEGYYNRIIVKDSKVKFISIELPKKDEGILNYNKYLEHDIEKIILPVKTNNEENNDNNLNNYETNDKINDIDDEINDNIYNTDDDSNNLKMINLGNKDIPIPCVGNQFIPGLLPKSDPYLLQTFNFKFNSTIPLNMNLSVPSFNIYDIPPGLDILSYYPVIDNDCEFSDTGDPNMIFPGIPCAPPQLTFCKKRNRIRMFGRTIKLPDIIYPCGIKFKTNYKITLEKSNLQPDIIYSFDGCGVNVNGNIFITGRVTSQIILGVAIVEFLDILRIVDINTFIAIYQYYGEDGDPTQINVIQFLVNNLKKSIEWFLELGFKLGKIYKDKNKPIISVTITSINFDYTIKIDNFNLYYQNNNVYVNNLSYTSSNNEILTNGRYISLGAYVDGSIKLDLFLGTYILGYTGGRGGNIIDTVLKMVSDEINNINNTPNSNNNIILKNRATFLSIFNNNLSNILSISDNIPILYHFLNDFKIKVDFTMRMCLDPKLGYAPVYVLCCEAHVDLDVCKAVIFQQIDTTIGAVDLQLYTSAILDGLPLGFLPQSIKDRINYYNSQVGVANGIYKNYIDNAVNIAKNYLNNYFNTGNFNIGKIKSCVPILPV